MRNLDDYLNVNSLLELEEAKIGVFCENVLDTETLVEELENFGPFAPFRKRFCEYLGIGESTLTGWLKGGRVPRMAKEAYVLLVAFQTLKEEVNRLRGEAEDLKIVQDGDKFHVIQFRPNDAGTVKGKFIARDITNEKTARIFAGSMMAFGLAQEAAEEIQNFLEMEYTENSNYIRSLENLTGRIKEKLLATFDPDKYRKVYRPVSLFDLGSSDFQDHHIEVEDIDLTIKESEDDEQSTSEKNETGEE